MSLYLKYRPKTLEEVVGNRATLQAVKNLLEKGFPHAALFVGPTGCGKTTLARIIANELGAGDDFVEVDSADFRGIDTIRDIRRKAQFMPVRGKVKVYLLDECHKLSNDAQTALLKILEDTPEHVYFFLATTHPQNLIDTIKGRTTVFNVSLLSEAETIKLLRSVVRKENETLQKIVYEQIYDSSQGHPRNALQILERVLAVPEEQRLEIAKKTFNEKVDGIKLCRALINRAPWKKVAGILKGMQDEDPENVRLYVLGYAKVVLLNESNERAAIVIDEFSDYFYSGGHAKLALACYTVVKS